MSEDITYCLNKDCKKTKCERHASHIKYKAIPHSFAMFDCSDEKPRKSCIAKEKCDTYQEYLAEDGDSNDDD